DSNKQKCKMRMNEFIERRCCNNNVNLFCIFCFEKNITVRGDIEDAMITTINNGLPFIEKDKYLRRTQLDLKNILFEL
ncbi:hypothetical protein RFI_21209, partial [Reticulomyxa filosa]